MAEREPIDPQTEDLATDTIYRIIQERRRRRRPQITPEESHAVLELMIGFKIDPQEIQWELNNPEISYAARRIFLEQVVQPLSRLDDIEREILSLCLGVDGGSYRTQAEVGQLKGCSRWTVGRIERRALAKLQPPYSLSSSNPTPGV